MRLARANLRPHSSAASRSAALMMHEPADVLLAFGERAVGRQHVAVLEPHDGGRARGVQAPREDPRAGGLHLLMQRRDVPHHLLQLCRAAEVRRRADKR